MGTSFRRTPSELKPSYVRGKRSIIGTHVCRWCLCQGQEHWPVSKGMNVHHREVSKRYPGELLDPFPYDFDPHACATSPQNRKNRFCF